MPLRRSTLALLLLLLGASAPLQRAEAQADPGAGAPADEARAHFERGVALFDEGRPDAALAEFEAAYEAAPNYRVLFNLAQVHARLGHAVRAVDAYERFLREGGDGIEPAQRERAEAELATQRARIGGIEITVGVPGASVSVDGSHVARAPLEAPIPVAVGEHLVEVSAPGYLAQRRRVSVAGESVARLSFDLQESGSARGSLRVSTNVRDVDISVDGEVRGRTPLDGSLSVPSGLREVRATRPGYLPLRRTVEVGMGAEAELALTLEPDLSATEALGRLTVRAPLGASVFLDGDQVEPPGPFTLPEGDHELRVEMPEMVPTVERVVVEAGASTQAEPALRYTPAVRAERLGEASALRTAGAALSVVGGVLLAGGAALTIWNEIRRNDLDFDQRRADLTRCASPPDLDCVGPVLPAGTTLVDYAEVYEATEAQFNAEVTEFNVITGLGYGLIALGAASILGSVVLLVSAPSDEDAVRVRASLGPGGVALDGTF